MFTPLGLFKDIACPQGEKCPLLTCIFSHKPTTSLDGQGTPQHVPTPAEAEAAVLDPPAPKRIKIEATTETGSQDTKIPPPRDEGKPPTSSSANVANGKLRQPNQSTPKLQSTSRDISPPPTRVEPTPKNPEQKSPKPGASKTSHPRPPPRQAPKESLNPRMIPKPPAAHNVRLAILTKLHAAICALNDKVAKNVAGPEKYLVLTPNELITMALDEEEKVAKENTSIYSNIIKLRIVKFSKMSQEDWIKEVKGHLNSRYYKIEPIGEAKEPQVFTTGLSPKEEIAISRKLVTPLNGLEEFGYVTRAPTEEEIEQARKGVLESKGWEKCERCAGRFQVFPGRREDGLLTTGGQCTYHPGRPVYPPKKKTDHITGSRDVYYPCCNESVGTSAGCTKGETHVFKVSEAKRLASILQFEKTPEQPDKGQQQPVCFDCEMAYTTQGLELIRLTAVCWPEAKELLDILVRPIGEILDLNSRFSGVFPEHYATAIPYGPAAAPSEDGELEPTPMHIVESPAAARELLFQFLQPDTPLIGHAIDNDLNACRIIHPTVIDTVLLYPHPAGLPMRSGLKVLSRRHLDRDIQTGGNRGHDSKEDSIATGDLVRVKALETWKRLQAKGWTIQDDKLVAPPGADAEDATAVRALGPGAGQKRKGTT